MNIIYQEIKNHFKSWSIWSIAMGLFVFLIMLEFSAYYNNPELLDILEVLPQDLMQAFGLVGLNLTELEGFVSVTIVYVQLMGSIYAIMLGIGLLLKEHTQKTSEFLYVMPIKRNKMLLSKVGAGVVLNFLFIVVVLMFVFFSSMSYNPSIAFGVYLIRNGVSLLLLMNMWLVVGMFLVAVVLQRKSVLAFGVMIVFVMYVVNVMIELVDFLELLVWVSPFSWFVAREIFVNQGLELNYVIVSLGYTFVFLVTLLYVYQHKNIVT